MSLLSVSNLNGWYGPAQILFDIGFELGAGEVVALLGRNGAGKSTTMRALMGLLPRREGTILFDDRDLSRAATHTIAKAGLGWVPEERRIFTDLTVEENLEVGRQKPRPGAASWEPERLYALFPNLAAMRRRRGGEMSGGEQQMLTIARTLMGNPRLILLDEPAEGLAPIVVETLGRAIQALKADGLAILISEQNLSLTRIIADRVVALERGQVRFTGTPAEYDAAMPGV